jgi:hypothetical protein
MKAALKQIVWSSVSQPSQDRMHFKTSCNSLTLSITMACRVSWFISTTILDSVYGTIFFNTRSRILLRSTDRRIKGWAPCKCQSEVVVGYRVKEAGAWRMAMFKWAWNIITNFWNELYFYFELFRVVEISWVVELCWVTELWWMVEMCWVVELCQVVVLCWVFEACKVDELCWMVALC